MMLVLHNYFNPFNASCSKLLLVPRVQRNTGLTHYFLIFDIRALWHSFLSARVPEYQKIKNGGLNQYSKM